jgi:hypothetical protein
VAITPLRVTARIIVVILYFCLFFYLSSESPHSCGKEQVEPFEHIHICLLITPNLNLSQKKNIFSIVQYMIQGTQSSMSIGRRKGINTTRHIVLNKQSIRCVETIHPLHDPSYSVPDTVTSMFPDSHGLDGVTIAKYYQSYRPM